MKQSTRKSKSAKQRRPTSKKRRSKKRIIGFKIKRARLSISDSRLQRGLAVLREDGSIASAAKAARMSPEKFKRTALKKKAIRKKGKVWIVSRELRRQMLIYSDGKQVTVTLPSQRSARNVGKYMSAVGAFVRSNNIRLLDDFIDRGVTDIAGKRHIFETDPNTLYRLTSSKDEAFEDVYRIVVN